jgi:RND superfamily putative drug exporter
VPALIVFDRSGGLTSADLNAIGRLGAGLERLGLTGASPVFAPFSGGERRPLGDVARIARGVGPISRDGEAALVALAIDSNDRGAIVDGVAKIRAYLAAHRRPGLRSYVTGPAGVAADLEQVAEDAGRTLLIATLSLVLLLLLLVYLIASFAATLGLVTFAFTELFGADGIAFDLVLLSFIFLVALGVDYNIFLMTRAREEAARHGTREGVLRALESTGSVVTGAGLILAGTFATLTLLPLEELVQIGAMVAIGVLLDTFVVRSLLIPAITYLCGERAWWPGSAS